MENGYQTGDVMAEMTTKIEEQAVVWINSLVEGGSILYDKGTRHYCYNVVQEFRSIGIQCQAIDLDTGYEINYIWAQIDQLEHDWAIHMVARGSAVEVWINNGKHPAEIQMVYLANSDSLTITKGDLCND